MSESKFKPFLLHSHKLGPNPWKVAIVLEELELPYTTKFWETPDMKMPEYLAISVNGRVPALQDPNNANFTLWESGAIISYLADTYDVQGKISHKARNEKHLEQQWLYFQVRRWLDALSLYVALTSCR